jgi:hypothetical protein
MRRHGRDGRFIKQPIEERFWAFVDKSAGPRGCWSFTGEVTTTGYGRITDYWQKRLAHRFSYELAHGPIPVGMFVLHTCDFRACVNPAHLWLGTAQDNVNDALQKGRMRYPGPTTPLRGVANPRAKLTEEDVLEIRAAYGNGDVTVRALATDYDVSPSLIHAVVTRKTWRHI